MNIIGKNKALGTCLSFYFEVKLIFLKNYHDTVIEIIMFTVLMMHLKMEIKLTCKHNQNGTKGRDLQP